MMPLIGNFVQMKSNLLLAPWTWVVVWHDNLNISFIDGLGTFSLVQCGCLMLMSDITKSSQHIWCASIKIMVFTSHTLHKFLEDYVQCLMVEYSWIWVFTKCRPIWLEPQYERCLSQFYMMGVHTWHCSSLSMYCTANKVWPVFILPG